MIEEHGHSVLLSAAGRRVHLARLLQHSLTDLGIEGRVIASDISPLSSAMQTSPNRELVPRASDPNCLSAILQLVARHSLFLIVPTIDTELLFYAKHREDFARHKCAINISDPATVELAHDKQQTSAFLRQRGIPTPRQWTLAEARELRDPSFFPLVAKPRRGSASVGLRSISQPEELALLNGDVIVQSRAPGNEYTVDLYIDGDGVCRCAVPRLRLETRGGEVSKAITVRHPEVIALARRVADALPGARGVLNIQIFHDDVSGEASVIEINPRFGGGYPLAHQSGAPMTTWLMEEALGRPCSAHDKWREGVVMLRYDDAVFTDADAVGLGSLRRSSAPSSSPL